MFSLWAAVNRTLILAVAAITKNAWVNNTYGAPAKSAGRQFACWKNLAMHGARAYKVNKQPLKNGEAPPMNWTEGPATWKQLRFLSHHGYKPEHMLTKTEASELIRKFGGKPEDFAAVATASLQEVTPHETADHLRLTMEEARQVIVDSGRNHIEDSKDALASAVAKRQEFWLDTCRQTAKMSVNSPQVQELYQKHGCRFVEPTRKQVQYILEALDSVMPHWEGKHPELFYQTLELNFPELMRRH